MESQASLVVGTCTAVGRSADGAPARDRSIQRVQEPPSADALEDLASLGCRFTGRRVTRADDGDEVEPRERPPHVRAERPVSRQGVAIPDQRVADAALQGRDTRASGDPVCR